MTEQQYELALIPHAYQGEVIQQRSRDGYVSATAMCKAAGKAWADYNRLATTKAFVDELSSEVGIPIPELIQSLSGGHPHLQGTWVHPYVAIHLAQWLSPKFAVRVSQWVYEWMSGRPPEERIWAQFQDRVALTFDSVPVGYFGVFKESADIYTTMIVGGVNLGARMILDISVGQHWARHWRNEKLADVYGPHGTYAHNYPLYFPQALSNPQSACCYPEDALPAFRRWMRDIYMRTKLPNYLKSQVQQGKILAITATAAIGLIEESDRNRAKFLPA